MNQESQQTMKLIFMTEGFSTLSIRASRGDRLVAQGEAPPRPNNHKKSSFCSQIHFHLNSHD